MVDTFTGREFMRLGPWDADSKRNDFKFRGENEGINRGHIQGNSRNYVLKYKTTKIGKIDSPVEMQQGFV